MGRIKTIALTTFITALAPLTAAWACGATDTCRDVLDSFVGEVEVGLVKLTFSVSSESDDVAYYRLLRSDCADAPQCTTELAIINAVGSCASETDYDYTDASGADDFWYTLEVWTTTGNRRCAVEIDITSPQS